MSTYIVIPSRSDIQKGFARLGFWENTTECIHVTPGGFACKQKGTLFDAGILFVAITYLLENPDEIKRDVHSIAGVFVHPGGNDNPELGDVARALHNVRADLRSELMSNAVAFTRGGSQSSQVKILSNAWNELAKTGKGMAEVKMYDGFKIEELNRAFRSLRSQQSREVITKLCILAQGCVDDQVDEPVRLSMESELKTFLDGEGSWLREVSEQKEGKLKEPIDRLMEEISQDTVDSLLEEVRELASS